MVLFFMDSWFTNGWSLFLNIWRKLFGTFCGRGPSLIKSWFMLIRTYAELLLMKVVWVCIGFFISIKPCLVELFGSYVAMVPLFMSFFATVSLEMGLLGPVISTLIFGIQSKTFFKIFKTLPSGSLLRTPILVFGIQISLVIQLLIKLAFL